MKIVAMIPCRLGSQRIPKKNLRLLDGKLLCQWSAEAALEANVFDDIYINSESNVFDRIAQETGVKFHQRPAELASNAATNDDFALEFINATGCDVLVQINPTSPFTKADDIRRIVELYKSHHYQTIHTVKSEQIEGLFSGSPLNFDPMKQMPPSQDLTPVHLFTSSIMLWDCRKFKQNMQTLESAVYGGNGSIYYYVVDGFSTLDIDNEEDFQMAEAVVMKKRLKEKVSYYEI